MLFVSGHVDVFLVFIPAQGDFKLLYEGACKCAARTIGDCDYFHTVFEVVEQVNMVVLPCSAILVCVLVQGMLVCKVLEFVVL